MNNNYRTLKLPKIEWIKNDLIPSKLGWSMKVTCKTGSGKTTFVSVFVEFLIKYIKTDFKIYLLWPIFNQNGWHRTRKKLIHVSYISEIKDICDSIIICDDM